MPECKRTYIGNDVWIAHNVSVKAGVTIGTGAAIGTGAVVTKNIPPYAIVAGVPAKIIRYRFDKRIICELLESKWWELSDDKLHDVGRHIKDPLKFVEFVRHLRALSED